MSDPSLNDLLTDLLGRVQGAVDKIVIKTNVGTTTITEPLADDGTPSEPSLPARALQPQIEVYVKGRASPIASYAPYGAPTPRPALGAGLGLGASALVAAGLVFLVRGITR